MAFLALRRSDDVDVERLVRRTATTSLPERRRQRSPRRRPGTWEESAQRGKGSAWERFWDFLQSLKIYVLDLVELGLGARKKYGKVLCGVML